MSLLILIGSIGLMLYAMQLMSEGLQQIAGDRLRHAQMAMTGNAVKGLLSGIGVTAFVQSSNVATMMAVSFVNAGIITLAQSMAVIMGANVGTTVTTWIIATLGFSPYAALWSFPVIALALPFFNSRKSTLNSWGELLLGFALVFISLTALRGACSQLDSAALAAWVSSAADSGLGAGIGLYALLILVTMLLTILVRSSAITFTVVAIAGALGCIDFGMACLLIICTNIATCIPTYLASRKGNHMARRAALWHLLFNLIGMVWALALWHWLCPWASSLCQAIGLGDPYQAENLPVGLAFFHTSFNLITACLLLPFSRYMSHGFARIVSDKDTTSVEPFTLHYIDDELLPSSGEMALVQVQKEVAHYAGDTYQMFTMIRQMIDEPMGSERQLELMSQIRHMEEASDKAELEIAQFLNQITPQTLSMSGELLCNSLYKIVDELESIADSIDHCSVSLYQKSEQRIRFNATMNDDIRRMLSLTDAALQHMTHVLSLENVPSNALDKAYNYEDELNNFRNQMRNQMLAAMERREVDFQQHSHFMLLINECEKMGDYVINVIAAASV